MTAEPAGSIRAGDWLLTPEGAAVHEPERVAVVADVHLGYEWARGRAGDSIPAHSLAETIERLTRLLSRVRSSLSTLIVAGDLVESRRPCRRTAEDVGRLRGWLDRQGVRLVLLAGNHDPDQTAPAVREVAGWIVGHGHQPITGGRVVHGHLHPVFRCGGTAAPCFLAAEDRIVLPAFSKNAAGLDVLTHPAAFGGFESDPRCLVAAGESLLDFGPLRGLIARPPSGWSFARGRR